MNHVSLAATIISLSTVLSPNYGHLPKAPCQVTKNAEAEVPMGVSETKPGLQTRGREWGTRSMALSLWGALPTLEDSGYPCLRHPSHSAGAGLFFRRKTHRRGQSALGPQLQKWVIRGKKVVKKRQTVSRTWSQYWLEAECTLREQQKPPCFLPASLQSPAQKPG